MGKNNIKRIVNQSVDFKKTPQRLSPINKLVKFGRAFDDIYKEPLIRYEFEKHNLVRETFSPNFN